MFPGINPVSCFAQLANGYNGEMILAWMAVIGGLGLLVWSAERFVSGAAATAQNLGVPSLIIGMIIMGFGTSAPEMVVSATAAWGNNAGLAVGNAIGSNIANIALVLGLAALVSPMTVQSRILRREFPALFLITLLAYVLLRDDRLDRIDGVILFSATFVLLGWLWWLTRQAKRSDPLRKEIEEELSRSMSTPRAVMWTVISLLLLIVSSRLLVWGAVAIARAFEVSDLVIGLTIIAVGTSLPETAVAIAAAVKGEHDMVIGNIIGSNMFNLLAVLGIAGMIRAIPLEASLMRRDFPVMLLLTVALYLMARGRGGGNGNIHRWDGVLLIVSYVAYLSWLAISEIKPVVL